MSQSALDGNTLIQTVTSWAQSSSAWAFLLQGFDTLFIVIFLINQPYHR